MKKLLLAILALTAISAGAQVKIGNNPTTINSSAALEVESTNKGLLPPRMTSVQMNAVASPAAGLLIYCTDCTPKTLWHFDGTIWGPVGGVAVPGVSIDCGANSFFTGNFYKSVATAGTKVRFKVDNNSFTAVSNFDFSTAVTLSGAGAAGLTITAGQNNNVSILPGGSQLLDYNITGTPTAIGTLTATFNRLGLICAKATAVGYQAPAIVCGNITQSATPAGPLVNGTAYSGTVTVPYTVVATGDAYPADTLTVNGLSLTRSAGTYSSLSGNVIYTVSGTYTGSNSTETFAISLGGSSCPTAVPKLATFTNATLACAAVPAGTYQMNVPMTGSNTKTVTITVATAGAYTASTTANNNVTFTAAGVLSAGAAQSIVLTASGTPAAAGTFPYTVTVAGQTCIFNVTYTPVAVFACGSATKIQAPLGALLTGTSYTGSYTIPYTAGNGLTYPTAAQTISGLTLTRVAGIYAAGGSVVYNLTGTYTGANKGIVTFTVPECSTVIFGDLIRESLSVPASIAAYDAAPVNTLVVVTQAEYENLLPVVTLSHRRGNTAIGTLAAHGANYRTFNVASANCSYLDNNDYVVAIKAGTDINVPAGSIKVLAAATANGPSICLTGDNSPNVSWTALTYKYFVVKQPVSNCGTNTVVGFGATTSSANVDMEAMCLTSAIGQGSGYFGGNPDLSCGASAPVHATTETYYQVIATGTKSW